jgi:hypothetical protein
VRYRYPVGNTVPAARIAAIAMVHGRARTIGRGSIRNHTFRLTLAHVHRGRYRLTVLELAPSGRAVVIGHTTLIVN